MYSNAYTEITVSGRVVYLEYTYLSTMHTYYRRTWINWSPRTLFLEPHNKSNSSLMKAITTPLKTAWRGLAIKHLKSFEWSVYEKICPKAKFFAGDQLFQVLRSLHCEEDGWWAFTVINLTKSFSHAFIRESTDYCIGSVSAMCNIRGIDLVPPIVVV